MLDTRQGFMMHKMSHKIWRRIVLQILCARQRPHGAVLTLPCPSSILIFPLHHRPGWREDKKTDTRRWNVDPVSDLAASSCCRPGLIVTKSAPVPRHNAVNKHRFVETMCLLRPICYNLSTVNALYNHLMSLQYWVSWFNPITVRVISLFFYLLMVEDLAGLI